MLGTHNWKVVDSMAIERIGYCFKSSRLFVQFRNSGLCYAYDDVPEDVWSMLDSAISLGSMFARIVRDKFQFQTLPDSPFFGLGVMDGFPREWNLPSFCTDWVW